MVSTMTSNDTVVLDILKKVSNKNKEPLLKMFGDTEKTLRSMPAAIRWHHSEVGGLYRHTKEVMEQALKLYDALRSDLRKRAITENDVILVSFIHDLEKLDKYKKNQGYEPDRKYEKGYKETEFNYNYDKTDMNDTAQVVRICAKYGIELNDNHLNAITFHHGGWSVDAKGSLKPLAVLLHSADLISANLFKDGG